ncbi:MAG: B12-binding domain-containing radical SAM protein [Candidatus Helarchaeota archaeon]
MKIILINPGTRIFEKYHDVNDYLNKKSFYSAAMPPMGLLYLDAILTNEGHRVKIIEHSATGISLDKILQIIKSYKPEIVGLSVLSNTSLTANKMASAIKESFPEINIIYGNCHATIWGPRILKTYKFVDFSIKGEGEYSFLKLVNALENNRPFEDIEGIVYRENNKIKDNGITPLIVNLDDIPFPNRDKLNINYTWDFGGFKFAQSKFTTILSSRGCPFKCIYCMNSLLARHKWRTRSINNIIDELLVLDEKKYREVYFLDDNFTLNRKRVIELCKNIRKEKLDIIFSARGRVDQNSSEMFKIMVSQGNFKFISFGVESGSQKILDYYNKKTTPQQAFDTIKLARKVKFDFIMANFMVGAPFEPLEDVIKTLKFALTSDITWPIITIVQAVPGTKMWIDLQKLESINIDKYWETGIPVIDLNINDYSRETLQKLIIETYNRFTSLKRFKFFIKEFGDAILSPYKMRKIIHLLKNLTILKGLYSEIADGMNA